MSCGSDGLAEPRLRLVGVDLEDDVRHVEAPESYSFLEWARKLNRNFANSRVDPITFALGALEDVSRRMDVLARELNLSSPDDSDDTDRPRAA